MTIKFSSGSSIKPLLHRQSSSAFTYEFFDLFQFRQMFMVNATRANRCCEFESDPALASQRICHSR